MSSGKPHSRNFASLDPAAAEAGAEKLGRSIRELRAFDVASVKERTDSRLESIQRKANGVLSDLVGMGSPDYKKHALGRITAELDTTFGDHYSMDEFRDALKKGIAVAISMLESARQAMSERLEGEAPPAGTAPVAAIAPTPPPTAAPTPAPAAAPTPSPPSVPRPTPAPTAAPLPAPATPKPTHAPPPAPATMNKPSTASASHSVLVLGAGGEHAVEFLARMGLSPAVLDAPSIERLDALRDAEFAIVLPGEGGDEGSMMLAIGFMLAALGRARICLLAPAAQQLPPALQGALRIAPDHAGVWQLLLAREMKRAGLDIDLNKAL